MKPWKDIKDMGHDELRRYARELVQAWLAMPGDEDVSDLVATMNAVGHRMEDLGMKPLVTIKEGE